MEEQHVVNRDPTFGSSLLTDDFGRRSTDDEMTASVEATAARIQQDIPDPVDEKEPEEKSSLTDPLLQNPDGATQMFTDMHGQHGDLDGAPDVPPAKSGMRHMAGLTVGAQRLGNTDWGAGTDGGRSGKPQDGIPYGSFTGV